MGETIQVEVQYEDANAYPQNLPRDLWPTAIFSDGGVMGASRSAAGGSWAWCHVARKGVQETLVARASGLLVPTERWPTITNNYAEFVAVVRALEALPEGWIGDIFLDSAITIGRLAEGWAMNGLPEPLARRGYAAVNRTGGTFWHLLDGHPTKAELQAGRGKRGNLVSKWNVLCDDMCNAAKAAYTGVRNAG